jgi:hypothetical protein
MGRPLLPIDKKLVEGLASNGCTNEEIATLVGCSCNTIERRFGGTLRKGRASLKMSLRRQQVEIAKAGNTTMLIWLGKQYLGQSDKQEVHHNGLESLYTDPREKHGRAGVAKTGGS